VESEQAVLAQQEEAQEAAQQQQEAEEAERSELKRLVLDQVALAEGAASAADALAHAPGRVLFSTGGARGGDRYRRRQRPT
jgi:hypothetical protein